MSKICTKKISKFYNCSSGYYPGICKAIQEYDPVLNEWKVVGEFPDVVMLTARRKRPYPDDSSDSLTLI